MAGGTIKGIILEIGGDTSGLQKALSKANTATSSLSKELRGVNSLLKLDPKNVELLEQKQTILNESIDATQDKLNQLQKIKEEADKRMAEGTKISEENYRNLQREIINTQNKLNGLTDELKQFNAQNSNWTKAGKKIQEYGNNITKVSEKVDEIGNKASVVSAGVVAGGTALVNSAMNLEDAVAKYVSSTNTAEEETEKYRQVLENINNNNYGEGYEDIADSMAQVKMQLKDINEQDLQNITEKAIALRDLFGYDVSESVRAVKAMMDNLNVSADEAFNLIAEGKKQGLDFSNELLDNINEYSVQFGKLGLSAEDMFNIFKSGAENGAFNLDKIGDAVKEFSIRAIDGSNTTIDGFKRIGLNADKMAKKFANGGETAKQAFIEVVNRLGSMDDKVSQSIAGVDLFGTMWEDLGPTVITSFSKMDNGISKSSDSMQKSIDQLYNTTKKKAETQLKRLQSLGADFGEEMLPVLEDLIDMAEGFIDKLEGMSDAEKENIVKIGLFVAGAGPLIKTMGTAGKTIGSVTNGIGIFSQAIGVATNKTTSSVKSVNNLAKVLTLLKSPLGIITLAITGATIAATALYSETNKNNQAIANSAKQIDETKNKYNEFIQEKNNLMNATLTETDNTQKLAEELKTLVDENGNVKDGYKDRVAFILNELNQALGTEYSMTGNVIDNYKELNTSIEELIRTKRANAILENEEAKYNEAREKRTSAYDDMIAKEKELTNAKNELLEKEKEYQEFSNSYSGKTNINHTNFLKQQVELQKEAVKSAEQNLNDSKQIYSNYLNDIATYENDQAIVLSGNEEKIEELIRNRTYTYHQSSTDIGETINHNIQQVQYEMQQYQQAYNQDLQNNDVYNAQKNQAQIEAGQKQLETLAQQLITMTSTTEEMTPQQLEAWKALASGSFSTYSEYVSKLAPEMQTKIQEATGIVIANTPEFAKRAGEMGQQVAENFDKNNTAKQSALNNLQGFYEGLSDDEKKQLLQQTAGDRADEVAKEFENGDYETSGKNVLQGLYNGLNNGTLGQNLINKAAGIAKNIAKQFNIEWDEHSPSKLMKKKAEYFLQPISTVFSKKQRGLTADAKNLAKDIANKFSNSLKLNRNLNMSNMNVTTGQINKQTQTTFTTPQITFNIQELDEARLQQCFNYINKKFGSQY